MEPTTYSTTFAGHANSGAQIGVNSGSVNNHFHATTTSTVPSAPTIDVPFRRDRDFVERPVLDEIWQRALQPAARVGVVGLGGVGKTQLAIEYAWRRRAADRQLWVFWVHASSVALFEDSYGQIAQQVGISVGADPKADVLSLVYNWLLNEQNGRWAMVVDNADTTEVLFGSRSDQAQTPTSNSAASQKPPISKRQLAAFLPTSAHGSIVVTSRSREVTTRLIEYAQDILEVYPMTEGDAVTLLTSKLIATVHEPASAELSKLVRELDCMPLAITQAAAYINQLDAPDAVSQYVGKLMKSDSDRDRLLQHDARDPRRDYHSSNSIILTWHTSFERIRQVHSSAARLLALMCLFDREGIPKTLLSGQYSFEVIEQVQACDNNDFEQDIQALRAYSLVGAGTDKQLLNMHRLVQYSTRKWLGLHNELEQWQTRYACVLEDEFPDNGEHINWAVCQTLLPHVEMLMLYRARGEPFARAQAGVTYRASKYAWRSGKYQAAERLARVSIHNSEIVFGYDGIQTLDSVLSLSAALDEEGQYTDAERMCRRAATGYERRLKFNDARTLSALDLLARILQSQGKNSEAEELGRRVLVGREQELGLSDSDTLESMNNLAVALVAQGKYSEAEVLNRQALAGYEKVVGASHPDTLTSVYCLAVVLKAQGQYTEALQLYNRAVQGYIDVLGPSHPRTLKSQEDREELLRVMEGVES